MKTTVNKNKSKTPLRYFFETVYQRYRLIDAKEATIQQATIVINRFENWLERPALLKDLNSKMLCDWQSWMRADEYAAPTIHHYIKWLLTMWRFAIKKRYLDDADDSPADVELLKRPRRLPVAWSKEEIETLMAAAVETHGRVLGIAAGRFWEAIISVAYDTGLRRAALIAIRLDELDMKSHLLRVPAERMKNLVEQIFVLSDRSIAAIAATLPPNGPARALLFPWPFRSPKSLDKRLRHILARAGLPTGRRDLWHRLRRTTASHIAAAAGEAAAIRQLGHSDASCIKRYVDPRFVANHSGANHLAGVAWNGRKVVIEEAPAPETDSQPPLIVRLSRSDWRDEGIGLMAPLCDRDGFTGEQLARVLDHLGIGCKEFAATLKVDRRRLGATLRGKAAIGVGLRKKIRSALGMNFVFPGYQEPPFVPPAVDPSTIGPRPFELRPDATITAILERETLEPIDLRQIVAYVKWSGVRVIDFLRHAGVPEAYYSLMVRGLQRITPRTRDKLRTAFGLKGGVA